jgi:hypothetical protein
MVGFGWEESKCWKCGEPMAFQTGRIEHARKANTPLHCPFGHANYWELGESEADKLRRERDQLKQRIAFKDDMIREAEARAEHERRRANGYKGHATKITKRAKAGVCPCCNRSFENLRRHMATKHPQFTPMELEDRPAEATVQ